MADFNRAQISEKMQNIVKFEGEKDSLTTSVKFGVLIGLIKVESVSNKEVVNTILQLPQQYNNISANKGCNSDTKENENENDNEKSDEHQCEKKQLDKSEIRRKIRQERRKLTAASIHQQLRQHQHQQQQQEQQEYEDDEEEEEEEEDEETLKSGPCSCYSTVTEDEFDDDTRTILRNSNRKVSRKSNNKYSLSKSLMSLNRDESSFLFNYLDDINNNNSATKFTKFKSEIEISETSFNRNSTCRNSIRNNSDNDKRHMRHISRDIFDTIDCKNNNETNECNASVNLDNNNKRKIFFISAAS
ncbi:hypothetical protein PVAND_014166 [Polypedilum vanderplanki]|uniref:Uncharacterized protein n=1 Tax=Polypedilum vanderplanki TaxID=319348 RepID=A0A9J6CSM4_POLVA|nr:hypothetical protein PVAND_014166 [Polypedilum vanderplanki]